MKPRPTLELLQILDKAILETPYFPGLCMLIQYLWIERIITAPEYNILLLYIQRYKPKTAIYYYPYWWPRGAKEPRHQFLQELIKKEQRWNRLLQVLRFWQSWRH